MNLVGSPGKSQTVLPALRQLEHGHMIIVGKSDDPAQKPGPQESDTKTQGQLDRIFVIAVQASGI